MKKNPSILHCIYRAFFNPFSIILFVLMMVSLLTDVLLPKAYGQGFSSVIIMAVMLLLGGLVRLIQELRAKHVADRLAGLTQTTVLVCRDGLWQETDSDRLVVGDLVHIEAGDRVPADLQLVEAKDLFVSQSVITGESGSFEKNAQPPLEKPEKISDYTHIVFYGTTVTGGSGTGIVQAVGNNTVYGGMDVGRLSQKQGFDSGSSSIALVLLRFMAILLPIVFLACGLTKGNWLEAFLFALSVAVGLTPEMLPMVVSACLAKGSCQMGKEQTVVKNINAMQTLGNMDILCVDKTGTLTDDTVTLEYYMDILGNESAVVLDYAFLNSYYHSGVKNHLDSAILKCRNMPGMEAHFAELANNSTLLDEQPFDYEHKYAGVLLDIANNQADTQYTNEKISESTSDMSNSPANTNVPTNANIPADSNDSIDTDLPHLHIIKGSVKNVLSKCSHAEFRGKNIPVTDETLESVHAVIDELTEDGMKVLAVAYRMTTSATLGGENRKTGEDTKDGKDTVYVEDTGDGEDTDFTLIGYLAFFDAPKKSAADTIRQLKELKVDVRVLTGDDAATTRSICSRLGIDTASILTGADFEKLSDNDRPLCVEKTKVFAELTPRQKSAIIELLQQNGHSVGFMGDGMNDLPAELKANVGISVDTAADAVRESADVILLKKDLHVLEGGILEGRRAFTNMTKYIRITASSNLGNICAVVVASILLPFLPMTSLQLLLLNLLYDSLCLILPWDNVDPQQLERPIRWDGKDLGKFMLRFGPISSLFDILTFAFLYFILCPSVCGGSFSQLTDAGQLIFITTFQTGWFLESMWTQVLILHLLRTSRIPFVQSKPSGLVFGVTITGVFLFTLFTVTPVGHMMGLTALPMGYYAFLVLDVLCYLLFVSIAKYFYFKNLH